MGGLKLLLPKPLLIVVQPELFRCSQILRLISRPIPPTDLHWYLAMRFIMEMHLRLQMYLPTKVSVFGWEIILTVPGIPEPFQTYLPILPDSFPALLRLREKSTIVTAPAI